jgi:hypothetical protein
MPDHTFTYPVFSEGEVISSEKLNNIPQYLQETLVRYIFEKHRSGEFHAIRSGVLNGFNILPTSAPMTVRLVSGIGIAVRPDYTLEPIIVKDAVDIRLHDPDPNGFFWQIINLVPFYDYDEYAQRIVRKPDGTIDVQNLPRIVNYSYAYEVYRGNTDPVNPPLPTGVNYSIVVAAIYTRPSYEPYFIDPNDFYDTRIFLTDTEGTTFDYFCVGQWIAHEVGQPPEFTRLVEKTTSRNIRILQHLEPIPNLVGHYHAQFAIPKALGTYNRELIDTTVDYPGVAFANVVFTNGYYPFDTEAFVQNYSTTQNLPYWIVNLYVRIRDANTGEFADIQEEHAFLQVRASLPRSD